MDFTSAMEQMVGQIMLEPIVLKKFLDDYKQTLDGDMIPNTEADTQIAMGLEDQPEIFKAISKKCDIQHLDQVDDSPIVKYFPGDPDRQRVQLTDAPTRTHKLKSFTSLVESKDVNARNPFRRSSEIYKLAQFPKIQKNSPPPEKPCNFYNDLLISVRIYRPTRATHIGRTLEKPVFAEEFQCLGSNFLTELRDKIKCICNKYHFFDISENPNEPLPLKETDPGFFFINDTFYNDRRKPENADYSDVVLKWAKRTQWFRNVEFKTACMEKTRFIDLTVSMGFPQLYEHHGNCEHLFAFSQIDILTPSLTFNQNVSRDVYPHLHSINVYNNRLCNMCGSVHYVYVVVNSDRQLHDPAYLCSNCFHSFHYIDGKKIGEFRAYRLQDFGDISTENRNEDSDPDEDLTAIEPASSRGNKHIEISDIEVSDDGEEEDFSALYNNCEEESTAVVKKEH